MSSPQIKHEEASLVINKDDNFEYQHTIDYLGENGYIRVSNVRETGEFSVKGDVIDIFPSGYDNPVRVDTFGNEIEKLQIKELKKLLCNYLQHKKILLLTSLTLKHRQES